MHDTDDEVYNAMEQFYKITLEQISKGAKLNKIAEITALHLQLPYLTVEAVAAEHSKMIYQYPHEPKIGTRIDETCIANDELGTGTIDAKIEECFPQEGSLYSSVNYMGFAVKISEDITLLFNFFSLVKNNTPVERSYKRFAKISVLNMLPYFNVSSHSGASEGDKASRLLCFDQNKNDIKILLVEDNVFNSLVLSKMVLKLGYYVCTVESGADAITATQEESFDLILMDCQMPNMSGYETTKILKKMMRLGEIENAPIIAVTAHSMVGDREKCQEAGMDDYLPKPVTMEQIDIKVKAWTKIKELV